MVDLVDEILGGRSLAPDKRSGWNLVGYEGGGLDVLHWVDRKPRLAVVYRRKHRGIGIVALGHELDPRPRPIENCKKTRGRDWGGPKRGNALVAHWVGSRTLIGGGNGVHIWSRRCRNEHGTRGRGGELHGDVDRGNPSHSELGTWYPVIVTAIQGGVGSS